MRGPGALVGALLAVLALAVMAPLAVEFLGGFGGPPGHALLAGLVIVAVPALVVSSQVSPGLARLVEGALVAVGALVVLPDVFGATDLAQGALSGLPLAALLVGVAAPLLVLTYVVQLGRRRLA